MFSKLIILAIQSLAAMVFAFTVEAATIHLPKVPERPELPARVIVKFISKPDKEAIIAKYKAKVVGEIPAIETTVLEVKDVAEAIRSLRKEKIDYVEVDAVATTLTNDTLYSSQWALPKISWDKLDATASAYNLATPSSKIAVVDTGVDYNHPDLAGRVDTDQDWDFVNSDDDALDDNLHGTHVAGIAAANTNNSTGVAGVSINTNTILPVKVLDQNGSGYYSWVAAGVIYAADHGAKVINLSLGGNVKSTTLENAVNYAWNKGAVVVAAAGNSNNSSKTYPGAYSNAMAVWASDQNDNKASFSSYGSWVDIGAPGVSILSTIPLSKDTKDGSQDGYYLANGTSMATPGVAGLAGLLFSQHPDWSAQTVRSKIESTADPVSSRLFKRGNLGKGRINVFKALTQ
jgi:thermitase